MPVTMRDPSTPKLPEGGESGLPKMCCCRAKLQGAHRANPRPVKTSSVSRLNDILGRLQNNTDLQRGSQRGAAKLLRLPTKLLRYSGTARAVPVAAAVQHLLGDLGNGLSEALDVAGVDARHADAAVACLQN